MLIISSDMNIFLSSVLEPPPKAKKKMCNTLPTIVGDSKIVHSVHSVSEMFFRNIFPLRGGLRVAYLKVKLLKNFSTEGGGAGGWEGIKSVRSSVL